MNRLLALWWRISGGLWFLPSLLVLAAVVAAAGLVHVESLLDLGLAREWPRLFGAGPDGAREMLSAIAGSMITVAGVVFSVTLVALSLAASQYSPRVLRTFMSDRPTQVVLGVFVGVFAYCLVVLRTIRGGDDGGFVPSLAVLGGIALAFVAIGFLVFFIHHLATSIEASTIVARIGEATLGTIDDLFPEELGAAVEDEDARHAVEGIRDWTPVACSTSGYIVSVDESGLLAYARERGRVLRMDRAIGDFTVRGLPLASLSGSASTTDSDCDALNRLYSTDRERTLEQDAAFGTQQMVDIALKALSPGINDQATALMCIDRLTEIVVRLGRRCIETPYRRHEGGLLVIAAGPSFSGLLGLAFDAIRESAGGKRAVLSRLLWALEQASLHVTDPQRLRNLSAHAEALAEAVERTVQAPADRTELVAAARRLAAGTRPRGMEQAQPAAV